METNYKKIIAESVTELLQDNSLTVQKFSRLSKISRSTIDGWLQEKHYPSLNQLISLADFFNCSIDYILHISDKKEYEKSSERKDFIACFEERKQSLNVTKYQIAVACKTDIACINKWEKLGQKPRIDTVIDLAKFFGCSVDYILGRTDKI